MNNAAMNTSVQISLQYLLSIFFFFLDLYPEVELLGSSVNSRLNIFLLANYIVFGCAGSLFLQGLFFSSGGCYTLVVMHRLLVAESSLVAKHRL